MVYNYNNSCTISLCYWKIPKIMIPSFITTPNIELYRTNNYLVFDIETTNKNKGDAREKENRIICGDCYSSISGWTHFTDIREIFPLLDEASLVVFHGGKFELKWLICHSYPVNKLFTYDTLLGDYVIAGNRNWDLDLDTCCKRHGIKGKIGVVSKLIKAGVCPSEIPYSLLKEYGRQDVKATLDLFLIQREQLFKDDLMKVFYLRNILTPVLADIEMKGMFLDRKFVHEIHTEAVGEHAQIRMQLDDITGGINMASPQQVAHFLYEELGFDEIKDRRGNPIRGKPSKQFPLGTPKTDEDTIELLKPKNKRQRDFLKFKLEESKLRKKISAYTTRFTEACENTECMLYGTLNQSVAGTHRLTSSNPNLQNIDRKLKRAITARKKGWKIRSGDYKQLEFRAAAVLGQDKQALEDILNGHDVHSYTSQVLTDAGQPTNRQDAKAHTFKPLYGGTSGTTAEQTYYKAFKEKYPEITATQDKWVEEVLRTKSLKTITGLRFYWDDTGYTNSGYIVNSTAIKNYPVQMFATADIAPLGVCLLWHELKERQLNSFIINLVHDSVIVEEDPDEDEVVGNLLERCLSKDVRGFMNTLIKFDINYPLDVDQKIGTHWDWDEEKIDE